MSDPSMQNSPDQGSTSEKLQSEETPEGSHSDSAQPETGPLAEMSAPHASGSVIYNWNPGATDGRKLVTWD